MDMACRTRFGTDCSESLSTNLESRVRWRVTHPAKTYVGSRERAFRRPSLRADCTELPVALSISAFSDVPDILRVLESTPSTVRATPGVHREDVDGITTPEEDPIFS